MFSFAIRFSTCSVVCGVIVEILPMFFNVLCICGGQDTNLVRNYWIVSFCIFYKMYSCILSDSAHTFSKLREIDRQLINVLCVLTHFLLLLLLLDVECLIPSTNENIEESENKVNLTWISFLKLINSPVQ